MARKGRGVGHGERQVLAQVVGRRGALAGDRGVAQQGQAVLELLDAAGGDVAGPAGGQVDRGDRADIGDGRGRRPARCPERSVKDTVGADGVAGAEGLQGDGLDRQRGRGGGAVPPL